MRTVMNSPKEEWYYAPSCPELPQIESLKINPLDKKSSSVTALIIMCEVDEENTLGTTLNVNINQYLKLLDGSLLKLDMDRGISSFWRGTPAQDVSWKLCAEDAIKEILTIVKADVPYQTDFPWEDYLEAAAKCGITIDTQTLKNLPVQIFFSDSLMETYEF